MKPRKRKPKTKLVVKPVAVPTTKPKIDLFPKGSTRPTIKPSEKA